jgi:hypothetical protein
MKAFQQIFECQLYGKSLAFWDTDVGSLSMNLVVVDFPCYLRVGSDREEVTLIVVL